MALSDPRKAATLEEASSNGDGTYNGYRALAWMSAVLGESRGFDGFTEDEVREIHRKAKQRTPTFLE